MEKYRNFSLHRQTDIFDHLTCIQLHVKDHLHLICQFSQPRIWIRPHSFGSKQSRPDTFFPCQLDGFQGNSRRQTKCGKQYLRIVSLVFLIPHLFFPYLLIFSLKYQILFFHPFRLQKQRSNNISFTIGCFTGSCPGFWNFVFLRIIIGKLDLFHSLTKSTIS